MEGRSLFPRPLRVAAERGTGRGTATAMSGHQAAKRIPGAIHNRHQTVDNFGTRPGASENAPFLPLRQAKSALALAPEGVTPPNVKMGMTKCARF